MTCHRLLTNYLVVCFLLAPWLQAQQAQWGNLHEIRPGTRIQVVENSLKSTAGKFVSFSETDLTLKVEGKEVLIPKDQIHRVSIPGKNRKRNTFIGLAAGTAQGVAWALALRNTENWRAGDSAGVICGSAGFGALIGVAIPATRTVYKSEAPRQTGTRKTEQEH
jgi:hypothetical protein